MFCAVPFPRGAGRVRHGGWSRPWRSHTQRGNFRGNRHHLQCFAAAAIAAETGGSAWSFGFPRRDHSGFLAKLKEIWDVLKDGTVNPEEGRLRKPPKMMELTSLLQIPFR